MKVLIISDEEELVEKTNSFFKSNGADTICYKWLLKALDNIEEIQPDLILLSSSEYPRHWKTLVQFVKSGIGGDAVQVYLYEPKPLSQDDEDKAKALGITGYFTNLDRGNLYSIFADLLTPLNNKENKIVEPAVAAEETKEVESFEEDFEDDEVPTVDAIIQVNKPGHVLITNPIHKDFIAGKVASFNNNRLEVLLDYDLIDVSNNDMIEYVTYFNENECYSFSAEIFFLNPDEKAVILTIKDKYEEI